MCVDAGGWLEGQHYDRLAEDRLAEDRALSRSADLQVGRG
jgi:hypothetical protein